MSKSAGLSVGIVDGMKPSESTLGDSSVVGVDEAEFVSLCPAKASTTE